MISDLLYRLRAILLRNRMERELDDELRCHIEHEAEKLERAGLSHDEARRRARMALGGPEQIKEECRDARGTAVLESFARDLRYAWRVLRARPGFTAMVVLSLGLGIGATTSIFTVINAALLRTLPVRDPQDLVVMYWDADYNPRAATMNNVDRKDPATGKWIRSTFPLVALRQFNRAGSGALEPFGFYNPGKVGFNDGAATYAAHCTLVTGNFFDELGVRMALGRPLTETDDRSGATVAVVTYDFWQRSLQGDAAIVGKVVRVSGAPVTVVGVSGPGFHGVASAGWGGPHRGAPSVRHHRHRTSARVSLLRRPQNGTRFLVGSAHGQKEGRSYNGGCGSGTDRIISRDAGGIRPAQLTAGQESANHSDARR